MQKNVFIVDYKYIKIAFRFLGIVMLTCFLCFLPSKHTYAKEASARASIALSQTHFNTENSSVEKMEENDEILEQMKKEQKELNQIYKEKIIKYKNSSSTLTKAQAEELQQINTTISKKNKLLKNKLNKLSNNKKKYQELNPYSEKAKKRCKNIIHLQNDIIKCMKKINRLFKREITILDSVK